MLSYTEAVERLYGYTYRGLDPAKLHLPDPGRPERSRALLSRFGDPQLRYPTVHITGTKGKGSVSAMTAAILQASGLKVGMLTSPHLQNLRERIQINREMIPEADFARIFSESVATFEALDNARFPECLAALAFQYFAAESVDVAVIEVGLGGRLDSTNVLTPEVAVFTSISFDHMSLLGETLAKIATEKSGIIKPGCAVVSAPQTPDVIAVLSRASADQGCPLTVVGRDLPFSADPPERDGQGVWIGDAPGRHFRVAPIGAYQAVNAAVSVAVIEQLRVRGFHIPESAIADGLSAVRWPGRLEVVNETPLVILDGAHNGESGLRLREALIDIFGRRPLVLVYGSKANKDILGMLRAILPVADQVILTRSADQITQDAAALIPFVREAGYSGALEAIGEVGAALRRAEVLAGSAGMVCVTGSLYIVGEVRTYLGLAPNQVG